MTTENALKAIRKTGDNVGSDVKGSLGAGGPMILCMLIHYLGLTVRYSFCNTVLPAALLRQGNVDHSKAFFLFLNSSTSTDTTCCHL